MTVKEVAIEVIVGALILVVVIVEVAVVVVATAVTGVVEIVISGSMSNR